MQCVVSNCDHDSSQNFQGITYYKFPEDPALRASWLEAVDLVGLEPKVHSTVCSAHFLKEDLLVSSGGMRRLRAGAVPVVEVRACRICLITDCKLYCMTSHKILSKTYETVTGLLIEDEDSLPVYLCSQCARRLVSCARFRTASLRAHLVLLEMVKNHGRITHELIKSFKASVSSNQTDSGGSYDNDIDIDYIIKNENADETSYRQRTDGQPRLPGHVSAEDIKVEYDGDQNINNAGDKTNANVLDTPVSEHVATDGIKIEIDGDEYDSKNTADVDVKVENDGVVERGDRDLSAGPSLRAKPEPGPGGQATRIWTYSRRPGPADERRLTADPQLFYDTCSGQSSSAPTSSTPAAAPPTAGRGVSTYSTATGHILRRRLQIHSSAKLHTCDVCSKSFNLKDHLLKHSVIHSDERPYSCDVCKKAFKHKTYLANHLRVHSGERPYSCHICKKTFAYKNVLCDHLRLHSGKKPFSCNICLKAFATQSTLRGHVRIHSGEKPYSCNVCNKSFAAQCTLWKHSRIHSGEKPYLCKVCNKSFNQKSNLKTHSRIHSGEKPYACHVCKKAFIYKNSLSEHLHIHSGEKPYSCNVCSKAFAAQSTLLTHLPIHSSEKPYSCKYCNKEFIQKANLTKHLRIHTGERPYSCDVCGEAFHYKRQIIKHLRKHLDE